MAIIRLEFDKVKILRPKERWQLYFILVTEHPTEKDKMVVSSFPDPFIHLKPSQDNVINFKPAEGVGVDGMFVLERDLPVDNTITARVYLRHSRQATRDVGTLLSDIKGGLGGNAFNIVTDILGSSNPWLIIAKEAIPLIGGVLKKINDRDFGFVSMDEEFGSEFSNQVELSRENTFSTGEAKICWTWSVK